MPARSGRVSGATVRRGPTLLSAPGGAAPRTSADRLADLAVEALIDEALLTPKPGLVDARDMDAELMIRSARSLRAGFEAMARAAQGRRPGQELREELAAIGRAAEAAMLEATGGVNTHRGAIWALGLITAAASIEGPAAEAGTVLDTAGRIAVFADRAAPASASNGSKAARRYGVHGAREEAQAGFPHVARLGLPALRAAREKGAGETCARLDALLAVMSQLGDTCLLHRGGRAALEAAQAGAADILAAGGTAARGGMERLRKLDRRLVGLGVSPGGSADLLAAALYTDRICR
ncbi:triphosphoribosyl-dephospho-CoA synthase [Saccharibacillus sp. CPCC 101409]|uniref:triphosphoribosyl-dephospho-CoA synthase n=1 Tax=Saccharibacillus sp. CPCC 101409 TaxID=3058041 RepID=UPI0026713E67|nr:triphosphoribosyl-dephospho-CoA synthase [Saccharibacillus sp. CPCC 101409]MDO3410407.1 triphosphoribosyl-dephospho-CoA synthase [Saccharibacillus sp. CPCC 101409]